jgi:hypothetical protein
MSGYPIATTNNTSPRICNFSHHGEHSKSERFWLQSGSGQPIFTWGSWTNVSLFDRIPNSVQFWSYQRINHYNSFSLLQEVFFHCIRSLLLVHPYLLQTRNSNNLTDGCLQINLLAVVKKCNWAREFPSTFALGVGSTVNRSIESTFRLNPLL